MSDHHTPQQQPTLLPPSPSGAVSASGVKGQGAVSASGAMGPLPGAMPGAGPMQPIIADNPRPRLIAYSDGKADFADMPKPKLSSSWIFRHKTKGGIYGVLNMFAKVKINGEWVPAVIYRDERGEQYVRTLEEFTLAFEPINIGQ